MKPLKLQFLIFTIGCVPIMLIMILTLTLVKIVLRSSYFDRTEDLSLLANLIPSIILTVQSRKVEINGR